ncbi:phage terminase small subunit P27 family [Clostridium perfringens]|uniref:phage terminase small subunit P27 family n=1 Tax=Clostridium perfringens TaxID=1502 RepID=UPI001C84BE2D|nr:phage terminase small subunit P27 family [Clostridium perfringens]EGT0683789.1 phage terminase small subunit P27 family [Clostridium perfringens]EGT0686819.1 phage terminase small subunit P27 family [Clostridium perfringens]EIF2806948.1 phage terminase small subunit P27 family [Clostridium perfringens]ELC8309368.1 phage terminase small subunit P27 family [Clostridium perfringens]ELC8392243.1 phage terminase small subunit P27 family [Clostridium perfringens]
MGRNRKSLDLQNGNLTCTQKNDRELEEDSIIIGKEQLENPPSWLRNKVAKDEWKRLVEQLKTLKIISNLDLNNLGAYCNAYSWYIETTKQLKKEPLIINYTNKANATNLIENPLIKIQMKYSDEMRKYASLLGLSIDSRLKLASLKGKKKKDKISDEFGDI